MLMGFSPIGLIVGFAVLVPNLLLLWFPPTVSVPAPRIPAALGWTERAGQALCLVVPAITAPGVIVGWWSVPAVAALAGYYALWARYLFTGRDQATLYRRWWMIPVPMAVLPVIVFFSTAGWLSNIWIAAAASVLAVGHIPASLVIAHAVRSHR
jgi:hypothetical protein